VDLARWSEWKTKTTAATSFASFCRQPWTKSADDEAVCRWRLSGDEVGNLAWNFGCGGLRPFGSKCCELYAARPATARPLLAHPPRCRRRSTPDRGLGPGRCSRQSGVGGAGSFLAAAGGGVARIAHSRKFREHFRVRCWSRRGPDRPLQDLVGGSLRLFHLRCRNVNGS
jgi:hypothetical protein